MFRLIYLFDEHHNIRKLARKLKAVIPLSWRLGNGFWEWYAFFEESQSWNLKKIQEYQIYCVRKLLLELISSSPYYRNRGKIEDIDKITSIKEFYNRVPLLSRGEFKKYYTEILNTSWKRQKLRRVQTSGTTGLALQFYHAREDQAREWAAICHQWSRVGYIPAKSRRAEFRGLTTQGYLIDSNPQQNMIRCSIINLRKENIKIYAGEIEKNEIDFYHGYPSALYLLAQEIQRSGIFFPQPKAVLLASEMVFDWQIKQIQDTFPHAKIYAHYGCAERTVLAGWCEYRNEYHVMPQYGLFEVDESTSEVIGTNLYNTINGFVRYRMTDKVDKIDTSICPECHRPYTPRIIDLSGRTEDFLFSPKNGWIPPAIVTFPLKSLKAIREVQFLQKEKDEICVKYSVFSKDDDLNDDLDHITSGLLHLFGKDMKIKFELVEDFERGATGKFKWIVCELEEMPARKFE